MKNYVKSILYGYPLLATVGQDYEEHIKNRAITSYDSRYTTEALAEYLAEEILRMRRLEWLKGKVEEALGRLTPVERELLAARYFGKRRKKPARLGLENPLAAPAWTERTYFRRQRRLGEKISAIFPSVGLTEEVFLSEFANTEVFRRIHAWIEAGKDKKISAEERRFCYSSTS